MKNKKIGIVVNAFPVTSETFIVNKIVGLVKAGADVTVFVYSDKANWDDFSDVKLLRSVKKVNLNSDLLFFNCMLKAPICAFRLIFLLMKNKKNMSISVVKQFRKLFLLKRGNNDIIHFEFSGIAINYLNCIHLLRPSKLYISCRGSAEMVTPLIDNTRKSRLIDVFMQVDRIHCVSSAMGELICDYGADTRKIFVNRPAVNDNFIYSDLDTTILPHGGINILSVGRLIFQKGYIYALMAVKEMVNEGYDVNYHIVGDGECYGEIAFFINSNGLSKNVFMHGKNTHGEILKLLNKSDIFLLSSVSEGIANSVLEAMAMGVPVVSTRAGGMEEVITNEYNGLLVDSFDYIGIKKALLKIIDNQELRHFLAKNGRKRILDDFTMKRQINEYVIEYNNVV